MMMKAERDLKRIKEFFELNKTEFTLRKFHKPILVYDIVDDKVRYSLWEMEILDRFGLKNVDGYDKTENIIYCPDWMQGNDEDEEDFDLEDDDL
jgi:hypothetical protein